MNRSEIINALADAIDAKNYIEIGVEGGVTFNEILIADKHGVDPDLKIETSQLSGTFSATTSDEFFLSENIQGKVFDIIFVDGLHTYEQSLRDVLNALEFVSDRGVVVIDDVLPSDAIAAMPSHSRCRSLKDRTNAADRNWMGDVYKTVAFINDFLLSYSYATTSDSSHLCVVWKNPNPAPRRMIFDNLAKISQMEYVDTIEIEDLYKFANIEEIVEKIRSRNFSSC